MLYLRAYASRVRVVVPDYAKSAATLIALGADEIYMGPAAELGPLDAQLFYEQEGLRISALDMAKSVEDLASTSMDLALSGGAAFLSATGLGRKETLARMLDFVSNFTQPFTAKLDPYMIHRAANELKVAGEYATRLLAMRQVPQSVQDHLMSKLADHLIEDYPSHGFVISLSDARRFGLPARDGRKHYDLWGSVSSLYRTYIDNGQVGILKVCAEAALGEVLDELQGGNGD